MWKITTKENYQSIYLKNKKKLIVHSSYTDIEGTLFGGKPEFMTEWGFENSDEPLLKSVQTKKDKHQVEWDVEFFIFKTKLD